MITFSCQKWKKKISVDAIFGPMKAVNAKGPKYSLWANGTDIQLGKMAQAVV